jgi:hypothetical protein
MTVEQIAKVCHQANKALCEANGDMSQLEFEDAPYWQKQSTIKGVKFNQENPEAPASSIHDSWLREKEAAGWKYGPVKNFDKKEHPCFVPYEDLPKSDQVKDYLFQAIVDSLSR